MTKFEELMIITMEECGELIQACSKMCRNRNEKHTQELIKDGIALNPNTAVSFDTVQLRSFNFQFKLFNAN